MAADRKADAGDRPAGLSSLRKQPPAGVGAEHGARSSGHGVSRSGGRRDAAGAGTFPRLAASRTARRGEPGPARLRYRSPSGYHVRARDPAGPPRWGSRIGPRPPAELYRRARPGGEWRGGARRSEQWRCGDATRGGRSSERPLAGRPTPRVGRCESDPPLSDGRRRWGSGGDRLSGQASGDSAARPRFFVRVRFPRFRSIDPAPSAVPESFRIAAWTSVRGV